MSVPHPVNVLPKYTRSRWFQLQTKINDFPTRYSVLYHAMQAKEIQPIRIQDSRCIIDGINTPNLPIMRHACVAMILLATVFYMAWYKMVIQRSLVYQENTSDSWDIPWYTTREHYITSVYLIQIHVSHSLLFFCPKDTVSRSIFAWISRIPKTPNWASICATLNGDFSGG